MKIINFEEIIDVPQNSETLNDGVNPLGKIPMMINDNLDPLFDSKVIAQYLDHYKSKPLFYPKDLKENISARLIETVADGICDAVVLIFLENSITVALRSKTWIIRQENKYLKKLNISYNTFMKNILCW